MEYIYYIEAGLLANAVAFAIDLIIGVYLIIKMGLVETEKMAVLFKENDDSSIFGFIHLLIPFFQVYLIIIQIILINKYFKGTATSVEIMLRKLDHYKIFKRFK